MASKAQRDAARHARRSGGAALRCGKTARPRGPRQPAALRAGGPDARRADEAFIAPRLRRESSRARVSEAGVDTVGPPRPAGADACQAPRPREQCPGHEPAERARRRERRARGQRLEPRPVRALAREPQTPRRGERSRFGARRRRRVVRVTGALRAVGTAEGGPGGRETAGVRWWPGVSHSERDPPADEHRVRE